MKKIMVIACAILLLSLGIIQTDNKVYAQIDNAERFFYKQLSIDQKHIYDTILASADVDGALMSGKAKVPIDMSAHFTNTTASEDDLLTYIQTIKLDDVTYAITRDHPELFWIYFQNVGFSKTYENGKLILTLDPSDDYYWDGIDSEVQVKQLKLEMNAKVDEIVDACKSNDRFQTLSCVNKWLVDNNTYNHGAANNSISYQLSWSATSALLSNNVEAKGPVCYGYAMAFKLLCDRLGIPCIEIEGRGKTSESTSEGHAWNYVQMQDGNWYAVDTTWNDVTAVDGQTRYFLVGSETITASGAIDKFSLNHIPSVDRMYPTLSTEAYDGEKGVAEVNGHVYGTLKEAIAQANGEPIDLLAEVDVTETLSISDDVLINLHGNSIINRTDNSITPLIKVENLGSLTLYDDISRSSDPKYLGDVVQNNSTGTVIENQGEVILRSIQLESSSTLISGKAYKLGEHSNIIASGNGFLNVGEIKIPTPSVEKIVVSLDEVELKTIDGLLAHLKLNPPTLSYSYVKKGSPLNPIMPEWNIKETGDLVSGQTYTLTTHVYGYDVEIPVSYGDQKTALTGSINILGKTKVGEVLSIDTTKITQTNLGTLSYTWESNGSAIANETSNTYTIKDSDIGKMIRVKLRSENYSGELSSSAVIIEKPNEPIVPDPSPTPDPDPSPTPTPDPNPNPNPTPTPIPTPDPTPTDADVEIKDSEGTILVKGKLPSNVKVISKELDSKELAQKVDKLVDKTIIETYKFEKAFDISLIKDNSVYAINNSVLVSIQIDDEFVGKDIGIIYIGDDGKTQLIESTVNGNQIQFKTSHFSTYAIVSKVNTPIQEEEEKNTNVITGFNESNTKFLTLVVGAGILLYILHKVKGNRTLTKTLHK